MGDTDPIRPPSPDPIQSRLTSRTGQVLAEIAAETESDAARELIAEIQKAESRGNALLALLPFLGPWLLYTSDVHSPTERRAYGALSIAITLLTVVAIWISLPDRVDPVMALHARAESELRILKGLMDEYHAEQGHYPDEETWMRFSKRADGRFFDPWARPYRIAETASGIRIFTLGRDGVEGGRGEDEDLSIAVSPK